MSPNTSKDKLVVLVVDDSVLIMDKMIAIMQEIENIRIVFQASSYTQALTIVEEAQPDIVLMDIFLGEKTGIELLKCIKGNYPSIKIIIITNHSGQHYRNICKKLGAHYFLDKSNDFDLIPKIISGKNLDLLKND
jgi:DNA-binding NarL/FixJ family response regulator